MRRWFWALVAVLAVEAVVAAIVGFAVTWGGVYDVAADTGHSAPAAFFLHFAMQRSIAQRARGLHVPPLSDPVRIARGAAYFDIGCALCHGSPDRQPWAGARKMLPAPPPLIGQVPQWRPEELFWIIKHGVRMTAMPSWPVPDADNEVWDMVAYLERLPDVDPAEARRLVAAERPLTGGPGADAPPTPPAGNPLLTRTIAVCEHCHGPSGQGDALHAFPAIAGLPASEISRALLAFRQGDRRSGFMKTVADSLSDTDIAGLAAYFGALPPPAETAAPKVSRALRENVPTGEAQRGAVDIAAAGCGSCHTIPGIPNANGNVGPPLDSLSRRIYLAGLLRNTPENLALWIKNPQHYAPGSGMPDMNLSNAEVADIAAYLKTLD